VYVGVEMVYDHASLKLGDVYGLFSICFGNLSHHKWLWWNGCGFEQVKVNPSW